MKVPNHEIISALESDRALNLSRKTKAYRDGICPDCNRKSVWISIEKPWWLRCDHEGSCGYKETIRERYPFLFENLSERYPSTEEDRDATARAYLSQVRGFPTDDLAGWYEQGSFKHKDGTWANTVRFWLFGEKNVYWERLIDASDVRKAGKKAHFKFGTDYLNRHWSPPGQEIKPLQRVFIVEGIFHAIAHHLVGNIVVAAFSCTNLPRNVISENKGQGIIWTLAYDDEPGARKHLRPYLNELRAMGETVEVALTGSKIDWDDLYNQEKLTEDTIKQCLWRGQVWAAETPGDRAAVLHAWQKRHYFVFDHNQRLYSARVNSDALAKNLDGQEFDHRVHGREFLSSTSLESISNFVPEFLYAQVDDILNERHYVFRVSYCNGNPEGLVELEGSNIDTPSSFHKAMLNNSLGGTFDGSSRDLKILRDRWLNQRITVVKSIPFIGYEPKSGAYIFGDFGYHKGRALKLNREGYLEAGSQGIRTSFKGFSVTRGKHNPEWFADFLQVFHWQGLTTLAFWLGSLFVQQIRSRDKSFPFLEVTGEPGAGKSTLLEFCWKLVGRENYEGIDPVKASAAGRRRAFAQVSNLPIVLIESDRGDDTNDKRKQFDFDELKPLFDGRGLGTLGVAKRSNDTEEPLFQGALVIAQNATVDASEAVLQRIVHCHCTREHHTRDSEAKAKWFSQTPAEDLAGFLESALHQEAAILDTYESAVQHYRERFHSKSGIKGNLGRLVQNHAQVLACAKALRHVIPTLSNQHLDDLESYLYSRALDRQERISREDPMVERFWDLYEYMNAQPDPGEYGHSDRPTLVETLNHFPPEKDSIAVNLAHFDETARRRGQQQLDYARLKKLLPTSTRYPFVGQEKVWSNWLKKTIHCWVFKRPKQH